MKRTLVLAGLVLLGALLLFGVAKMPRMGDAGAPDKTYTIDRYVSRGLTEAGDKSIPNDVLLNYRAFDTLVAVAALFTAFCAVALVLGRSRKTGDRTVPEVAVIESSTMSKVVSRIFVPLVVIFVAFIMLQGVGSYGYTIQAGTIAVGLIVLLALAYAVTERKRRMSDLGRALVESSALLLFVCVGLVGVFAGERFLTLTLPLSADAVEVARAVLMTVADIALGVAVAFLLASTLFSLMREGVTADDAAAP